MRNPGKILPSFLSGAHVFKGRTNLLTECVLQCPIDGDWAEFGVASGVTAARTLDMMPTGKSLFLLDSFDGLPEAWNVGKWRGSGHLRGKSRPKEDPEIVPAGKFACLPPVFDDERVVVITGLFSVSYADLQGMTSYLGFVHIDCDLYSSTVDALRAVTPLIGAGTIILFDEIWGYPNWRHGEHKALEEWREANEVEFLWIGRTFKGQAALKII